MSFYIAMYNIYYEGAACMISVYFIYTPVPGTEAHGGYTFCGFAALSLLQKTHLCDLRRLLVGGASCSVCVMIGCVSCCYRDGRVEGK